MALPTREQVLELLRSGTPAERAAFLAQLPAASFKDSAAGLFAAACRQPVLEAAQQPRGPGPGRPPAAARKAQAHSDDTHPLRHHPGPDRRPLARR